MSLSRLSIHELTPDHRDWQEYVDVIDAEGQARWAFDARFERFPRHYVAAKADGCVVGFVMYVVWDIGPHDRSHPPLVVDGQKLTEAKIVAFGVKEAYRRQGIGRALQEHAIRRAKGARLLPGAIGQQRRPSREPAAQAGHGIRRRTDGA